MSVEREGEGERERERERDGTWTVSVGEYFDTREAPTKCS